MLEVGVLRRGYFWWGYFFRKEGYFGRNRERNPRGKYLGEKERRHRNIENFCQGGIFCIFSKIILGFKIFNKKDYSGKCELLDVRKCDYAILKF